MYKPPALLCDIDMTIALVDDWTNWPDWTSDQILNAKTVEPLTKLLRAWRAYNPEGTIIFLSSRLSKTMYEDTLEWLKSEVFWDDDAKFILMLAPAIMPGPVWKEPIAKLLQQTYDIEFALEDSSPICGIYQRLGIVTLQVHLDKSR